MWRTGLSQMRHNSVYDEDNTTKLLRQNSVFDQYARGYVNLGACKGPEIPQTRMPSSSPKAVSPGKTKSTKPTSKHSLPATKGVLCDDNLRSALTHCKEHLVSDGSAARNANEQRDRDDVYVASGGVLRANPLSLLRHRSGTGSIPNARADTVRGRMPRH